jgi:lysophospholipase L1-like esterase
MRLRRWALLFATLALVTAAAAPALAEPELVPGRPAYLALGDSWAWGQAAEDPGQGGYVAQLHEALRSDLDCLPARSAKAADGCKRLQLLNTARPAMDGLPGVTAPLVAEEQLPVAIPLLEARNHDRNPRNDVEVVTLHVGGNDVSGPIQQACIGGLTPECLATFVFEMETYRADLHNVLSQLREAAGPNTPIVLGTYDNPIPFCDLGAIPGAAELGALLLEGAPGLDGLHDVIRQVASVYDAEVAEVFGQLGAGDFVGGADCLHPTDTGHDIAAEAFRALLAD